VLVPSGTLATTAAVGTMLLLLPLLLPCVLGDPAQDLMDCVDSTNDLDKCSEKILGNLKSVMGVGIPEAGLPPMDPLYIDQIEFKFGTVAVSFLDLDVRGIKEFALKKSHLDKAKKTWEVSLSVPELRVVGHYRLTGQLFIDLGLSEGPETFNATGVDIQGVGRMERSGEKVTMEGMDLTMEMEGIRIAMDCLFPKESGGDVSCCPGRWRSSCNPGLARTVHKFINNGNNGQKFVKEFQPQISDKIGRIIVAFINRALKNLKAKYVIED